MCESKAYSLKDDRVDQSVSQFYLDLIQFNQSVDTKNYFYWDKEIVGYKAKKEIKEALQKKIEEYVLESLKIESPMSHCMVGRIDLPYYNESVIRDKVDNEYKEKINNLAVLITRKDFIITALEDKIKDYNNLPWYKRIFKRII